MNEIQDIENLHFDAPYFCFPKVNELVVFFIHNDKKEINSHKL
ncbi:hypothetical protein [Abyssisolibacter fermentans]|nr:hypothetical protein [Abyssisolibacter fermentans]